MISRPTLPKKVCPAQDVQDVVLELGCSKRRSSENQTAQENVYLSRSCVSLKDTSKVMAVPRLVLRAVASSCLCCSFRRSQFSISFDRKREPSSEGTCTHFSLCRIYLSLEGSKRKVRKLCKTEKHSGASACPDNPLWLKGEEL